MTLTINYIDDAFAANVGSQDVPSRPATQYKVCGDKLCSGNGGPNIGSQDVPARPVTKNKVCGDRLCSESMSQPEAKSVEPVAKITEGGPFMLLIAANEFGNSPDTFNAIYKVYAGDQNVKDLRIFVKSDMETIWSTVGGIWADDYELTTIKIRALEPTSINAIITDWQFND
jgi:hypothetical protein